MISYILYVHLKIAFRKSKIVCLIGSIKAAKIIIIAIIINAYANGGILINIPIF